ncbi:MAG: hypothetical protein GWP02_08355 [Desulfobulbaceae bacterium]|nr:hypothetical protein [Desulfobulbaceae bacterium]
MNKALRILAAVVLVVLGKALFLADHSRRHYAIEFSAALMAQLETVK